MDKIKNHKLVVKNINLILLLLINSLFIIWHCSSGKIKKQSNILRQQTDKIEEPIELSGKSNESNSIIYREARNQIDHLSIFKELHYQKNEEQKNDHSF